MIMLRLYETLAMCMWFESINSLLDFCNTVVFLPVVSGNMMKT